MMRRRVFLTTALASAGLAACSAGLPPSTVRLPEPPEPTAVPNALDLADFGAVGDGETDDSAALQEAVDAAAGRRAVGLDDRRYLVGDVRLRSRTRIVGPGTLVFRPGARHTLTVNPGTGGTADPADNVRDITIDGVDFVGTSRDGFSEFEYQIWLSAVSDVTIRACRFEAFQGDAIMIGSGEDAGVERHNRRVKVLDCRFDGVNKQNRNAISVIDVDGLQVTRCGFTRCSRPDMPGAIDVEPNPADRTAVLKDLAFTDNLFADIGGNVAVVGLSITPPVLDRPLSGLVIRGNTFDGYPRSAVRLAWERREGTRDDVSVGAVVEGNVAYGRAAQYFGELRGLRGVILCANRVENVRGAGVLVGYFGGRCVDVSVDDNDWTDVAPRSSSVVTAVSCDRLTVSDNRLRGGTAPALVGFFPRGTTSQVAVTRNPLPAGVAVGILDDGHVTTPQQNRASDNGAGTIEESLFVSESG
ncbi:hypothetical protein [Actinomycetospora sp. CA-084318]|uniref:right-handed parallel beta-helix repeat-containing protein n=1 Tax=Actinomycetospora sp. CA-084318 TaxID=3239892 RepID=UPI003D97BAF2